MKQTTLEEVSAGGVVYRAMRETPNSKHQIPNKFEFLIGKHSGYHKWVLPKGLVEKGESQMGAAVREVAEEVGVAARIVEMRPLKTIEYYYFADLGTIMGQDATGNTSERRVKTYQEDPTLTQAATKVRIHKQVIFYLMEMETDLGAAGWEMEERRWVSAEEALQLLAFETEREVFGDALKGLGN